MWWTILRSCLCFQYNPSIALACAQVSAPVALGMFYLPKPCLTRCSYRQLQAPFPVIFYRRRSPRGVETFAYRSGSICFYSAREATAFCMPLQHMARGTCMHCRPGPFGFGMHALPAPLPSYSWEQLGSRATRLAAVFAETTLCYPAHVSLHLPPDH